jgi:hypothetical protein
LNSPWPPSGWHRRAQTWKEPPPASWHHAVAAAWCLERTADGRVRSAKQKTKDHFEDIHWAATHGLHAPQIYAGITRRLDPAVDPVKRISTSRFSLFSSAFFRRRRLTGIELQGAGFGSNRWDGDKARS